MVRLRDDERGSERTVTAGRRRATRAHLDELAHRVGLVGLDPAPGAGLDALLARSQTRLAGEIAEVHHAATRSDGLRAGEDHQPLVRALYALVAGLEGAAGWHSPAAGATHPQDLAPRAGDGHEYHRDRNRLVAAYEQAWLDSCVCPGPDPLRAVAFASGMAAVFTLAAMTLASHPCVIASRTTYHETGFLLSRLGPPDRVVWLDELSVRAVVEAVASRPGSVVLIDGQENNARLTMTDWPRLLAALEATGVDVTVVIDVSLVSVRCQPFVPPRPPVRVVTVESLTKFGQQGLDRVAGGIVVADRAFGQELDRWREHGGTILPLAALRQLPAPARSRIEDRLQRHEANALRLARLLRGPLAAGQRLTVVHPGLDGHPSRHVARRLGTTGTMLVILGWPPPALARLATRTLERARVLGVRLSLGASFGFDSTRIEVITPWVGPSYLRLAAGDGPIEESDGLARAILGAARDVVGSGADIGPPGRRSAAEGDGAQGAAGHA